MDATLLELIKRMEVKVNIMEEERRAKALHDLGVQRMNETRSTEDEDIDKWIADMLHRKGFRDPVKGN